MQLTTPDEFINYYWDKLQEYFSSRNIQISKLGFIGYFLNILGFTQYDVKQYYDNLFNESFPIVAQNPSNLYFHSTLHGYIPPMATYASLYGEMEFINYALPVKRADVIKREIYLQDIKLNINNIQYMLESKYQITEIAGNPGYILNILTKDSQYISTGYSELSSKVPIYNLNQVKIQTYNFTTPNYNYSTYYSKIISISQFQLADIEIYINGLKYDVEYVKNFRTGNDKVVFIRYLNNTIIIEFGSGIHGEYVPNSTVNITLTLTNGKIGNIGAGYYLPISGTISVVDTLSNSTSLPPYTFAASNFIRFNILYGSGGSDLLDSERLRTKLIEYIRTRNNLVSESDYKSIFSNYLIDFDLLFKKIDVRDNHIYNHALLYNQYMVPFSTTCITPLLSEIVPDLYINNQAVVIFPEFIYNSKTYLSPFMYIYDNVLQMYKGYILYDSITSYFDKTTLHVDNISTPPLSFELVYIQQTNKFRLFVKSYQSITNYVIKMNIPSKNIITDLLYYNDNTKYYDLDFFIEPIDILFDVIYLNNTLSTLELNNLQPVIDMSDYISVKKYIPDFTILTGIIFINNQPVTYYREPTDTEVRLVNFPVVEKTQFIQNKKYIIDKLYSMFTNIYNPGNRMISDDIQFKFLNNDVVESYVLEKATKQQFTFNLQLPLKIIINIIMQSQSIISPNINITNELNNLKHKIASLLQEHYTGTSISFYNSQIIDFLHNISWIKSCDVQVFDSNGVRLLNDDIESYSNMKILKSLTDKFEAVKFVPIYWWWDLENIVLNTYY